MSYESKDYKRYLDLCNSEEYQLLQQFYHKKTLFDILGVARQENPHSSFISWLLDPFESHGMGDFPMKRFLETLCFADMKYGQDYLTEENLTFVNYNLDKQKTAREKLLFFHESTEPKEKTDFRKKLMQGNYRITVCKIERERVLTAQRRADIYIDLSLQIAEKPYRILLFIENKVKSGENDSQTDAYMNYLLKESGKESEESNKIVFIVPIFLTPDTNSKLVSSAKENKLPCINCLFLLLNYQYLMDGVLAPCRTAFKGERIYDVLTEYVSCLGKSIDDSENNVAELPVSIMAVSREEKKWSRRLWENHQDTLMLICQELCGATDERFVAQNLPNEQFYRTLLSVILLQREELKIEQGTVESLQDAVRTSQRTNKRISYSVWQKNDEIWSFVSGKRGKETLGALAYVILRQYILLHKDESAKEIRSKLQEKIKHSWLDGIFITKEELKELSDAWVKQYSKENIPVCQWRYPEDDTWTGCPLETLSAKISKEQDEQLLQRHGCPLDPELSNKKLHDWYHREKKSMTCYCLYCAVHDFFVKDLGDIIRKQAWGKDGVDASFIFKEKSFQKGNFNTTFGALHVDGWVEDFVFVARYWGVGTLDSLLDTLEMWSYVGKETATINKRLDFNIPEL